MIRCVESSGILADRLEIAVTVDHRLREIGCCFPDGSPVESRPRPVPPFNRYQQPGLPLAEGVESWNQVKRRLAKFLKEVTTTFDDDSSVLVFSHHGIVEASFSANLKSSDEAGMGIFTKHAAITHWKHSRARSRSLFVVNCDTG